MCDTDLFQKVIQTWTNSKAGTLTSVAVNIAGGKQDTDVEIFVFRFTNTTTLLDPAYVSLLAPLPPPLSISPPPPKTPQHNTKD